MTSEELAGKVSADVRQFYDGCLVVDAVSPLLADGVEYLPWYREGGITVVSPTVGSTEDARSVLARLSRWQTILNERDSVILMRSVGDALLAKASDLTAIYFHIQGVDPLERNLDNIALFKQLGVQMIQLAYNVRNHAGDGCEEPENAGLSRYGMGVVRALNAARVAVDISHTGWRTSFDAIEASVKPVVASHSNCYALHPSPRNVSDDLIRAVAASGGLVGVVGFPSLVSGAGRPTLDEFVGHIRHISDLVGVKHVGLGVDYYLGQVGVAEDDAAIRGYEAAIASGIWSTAYGPPPHYYPAGIETPRTFINLAEHLLKAGFAREEVRQILGGNWLRVLETIWS